MMAMDEQEQVGLAEQDFAAFRAWVDMQPNWQRIQAALELVTVVRQNVEVGKRLQSEHLQMAVQEGTWLSGLAQGQGIERLAWYFSTVVQAFQSALDAYGK